MKYNELKIQCLLGEKLLSQLGIVVNHKTLSVLLNKETKNIEKHLNRMSPTYYTRYADNKRSYGCILKYRAPTKRAKKTIERLSYRFLMESHLNLKKNMGYMDYTGFYFFEGIDNFKDVFDIDLRLLILNNIHNGTEYLDTWKHHYNERFEQYDDPSTAELIINNFKWYHPYTDRTTIDYLLEYKSNLMSVNENLNEDIDDDYFKLRDNDKTLKHIEKMIENENLKFKWFTGSS